MLVNEVRVVLEVSGVTSIDGSGLEAALKLMHTVHTWGGTVREVVESGTWVAQPAS
jgi:anti-anti-sigma regulatory factor